MGNSKEKTNSRRNKGDGGLRQLPSGSWEGIEKLRREDGKIIPKSVTRPNKQETLLLISQLRALCPLKNDVSDVKIDRYTNQITFIYDRQYEPNADGNIDKAITVDEYVDYWLWNHRRKSSKNNARIKDRTFEDYVQKCAHIKKKLGTRIVEDNGEKKEVPVLVSELTFNLIEKKLTELSQEISYVTVIQVRNHVYNMLRCAKVKDHIIEENPLTDQKITFECETKKEERPYIKEKYEEKVIQYCITNWYIDVLTQFFIGARVSEIRGLRWTDLIVEECAIKLNQAFASVKEFKYENGKIESLGRKRKYTSLKSPSSYRTISIPEEFLNILLFQKYLQQELAKKLHIEFQESDPIFTTKTYNQLGRDDTNDRVKKVVKDLKVLDWETITSHCLRHGFCYAGLLNDVPLEYMQILLGHEDISVTREWYAHFEKEKIMKSADKVNEKRKEALKKYNEKFSLLIPKMPVIEKVSV